MEPTFVFQMRFRETGLRERWLRPQKCKECGEQGVYPVTNKEKLARNQSFLGQEKSYYWPQEQRGPYFRESPVSVIGGAFNCH